jgi:hypothetical protein
VAVETDSRDQLTAWVRTVSDADISFAQPSGAPPTSTGVSLYLLEMRGAIPLRATRPDVRQLALSYLVTAHAQDGADAEALLVDLCFAVMDQPGLELDLDPLPFTLWEALGVPPQPAFRVSVALRRQQDLEIRPVLHPLVVRPAPIGRIIGVVRTTDNVPVAEARVEVPLVGSRALTDRRGRFRLDGIPGDRRPVRIQVTARGREVTRDLGENDDRSAVVITINPAEAVHA